MATHGKNTVIGFNGYDLTRIGNTAGVNMRKDLAPCDTFGQDEHTYEPGLKGGTFPMQGIYKGSEENFRSLFDQIASDALGDFIYAPEGAEAGKTVFMAHAHQNSFDVMSDTASVVRVSGGWEADGGVVSAISLGSPYGP